MQTYTWRPAALAGALLALAGGASANLPASGKAAPAWGGKTTAGKAISSAQTKGKVVLLNFFNFY